MNKWILVLWLLGSGIFGYSQDLLYENYVYVTNIKSVKFHNSTSPLAPPVVNLNSGETLSLSFDDVHNVRKDFSYRIVHCTRDWKPSTMQDIEYLDGYGKGDIRNFEVSNLTLVPYFTYRLTIPNRDFRWNKSGNYLLIVYEGEGADRFPVITRRFMVVENKVTVFKEDRRSMEVSRMRRDQTFDISINYEDFNIINPMNTVTVSITQNNRWMDAYRNMSPLFVQGSNIIIDNRGKITFPGFKPFRVVDIRSLDYANRTVDSLDLNDNSTVAYLSVDYPRPTETFISRHDAQGSFVIGNSDNLNIDPDYAHAVFRLEMEEINRPVYVLGEFTDWKPDDMYRMEYDWEKGAYILDILLKQGYYSYYYGVLTSDDFMDIEWIEGSSSDTENNYQVYVYYREPGSRYDRLIGYGVFQSNTF